MDNSTSTHQTPPTEQSTTGPRSRSAVLRGGAAVLGLGLATVLVLDGSRAAFTASTGNAGNAVTGGTVVLTDDDNDNILFSVNPVNGGQVLTRCINVTYTGTLDANIRLYATGVDLTPADTDPLAPGLTVKVETGTGAAGGSTFDCTGFSTPTQQFNAALSTMGSTYATGVTGFDNASGAGPGTKKSYRVTVTVSNNNSYQGKAATWGFTWEAQGKDPS